MKRVVPLFLILSACSPLPIPTATLPRPDVTPDLTPTGTSTPAPDATETSAGEPQSVPTLAPTALPTPRLTPFAYDHNPRALLIEADISGGFAPVPRDEHVSTFRLYGDGLVVFAGERAPRSTGLDAMVRVGRLSTTQVQNLLAYLQQIGFFTLGDFYQPRPAPSDMPTAHITVYLGKAKTVSVYAPGFEGTPESFSDAFTLITQTIPVDAEMYVPTDGYLVATDAGPASNMGTKDNLIDWSNVGVRLADATDGLTVSGKAYSQIVSLRADNPPGSLFREGDRVYRARFAPNLPRAVHLSDWVGAILNAPREFDGRVFEIVGYYRGWNLFGEARGNSPVTRSDWVIADESGAMYVTGASPRGMDPSSRDDAWNIVRLRAAVVYVRFGVSYLEARRVEVVTPSVSVAPTLSVTRIPTPTAR